MTANFTTQSEQQPGFVANSNEFDFLSAMSGEGLEQMNTSAVTEAYLGMVQPDSAIASDNNPAGTWRNSANGRNYGNVVKVVPLAFRMIWSERESDPPFRTVGRYPIGGIKVETRMPTRGKRGFPKMINPETGNEVQELFIYALMASDYTEDGVIYFNPTVGSMRMAKQWNNQLKGQLLPNGVQAPIFAYTWNLVTDLVQNPQQPAKQMARLVKVERGELVNKEFFNNVIQPQLAVTKRNVLELTSNVNEVIE